MRSLIIVVAALAILVGVSAGVKSQPETPTPRRHFTVQNITQAKVAQEVYNECNLSRQNIRFTEEQCGEAQDATNTEFLCQYRNSSPNNNCWIEFK